ncbi:ABC transporter substrate-binding protein [Bacillus alkalicola]|uniref:ABC transporter substrate-binding protein n=2 Tax=Bacillales TaxID=1385 RepID=A0ABS6K071_9BACI|nr:ABC transporter substrate-binding protein [Bacillus alkalicola]MBU9722862.1 ABC transporter substrate-binding protein [Bacillus alkalicola]
MMKKNWLYIAMLALILVFAACSTEEDASNEAPDGTDDPDTEEEVDDTEADDGEEEPAIDTTPITYHYFNAAAPGRDMDTNETRIGQILEERTGVNFTLEHIVGDINTKIGVMVASGDYPDVVIPDAAIDIMLDAEAFIPLNDLLEEHGPTILEIYGPYLDHFTMADGNIYYLPFGATINDHIPDPNINQGAFWIQRAVLEANDYPNIKTIDQYFELIENYAAENPQIDGMNVIPYTGLTYDWRFFAFSNIPNHLAGYPNDGGVMVDMETHEASVYADSEYAKRWLEKLNEIYHKGLLDEEMFVSNYDEYLSKLASGRVLGFFDYGWQFGDARIALQDAGNPEREFMAFPVVFDEDIKDQYIDAPTFVGNRGAGITINAENPERIIQYWNELLSEEVQRMVHWGFEGEHYEVDENGRFWRTDEQIELARDEDLRDELGMNTYNWDWPVVGGTFSDGNAVGPAGQPEVAYIQYREEEKELLDAYNISTFSELFADPDDRPWFPAWSANIAQGSPEQLFEERSEEIIRRHYPRIAMAAEGEFESAWEEFVSAYRELDVEGYEQFFTEIVQARVRGEFNN